MAISDASSIPMGSRDREVDAASAGLPAQGGPSTAWWSCGTNGEGTSLSVDERKRCLEVVMEHRGGLQVIAGTGATSIVDALELTRHAADLGVDAALLLPPFFYRVPPPPGWPRTSILSWMQPTSPSRSNIPQMTSVPISDALLDRILFIRG